jgi:hypothetical protein
LLSVFAATLVAPALIESLGNTSHRSSHTCVILVVFAGSHNSYCGCRLFVSAKEIKEKRGRCRKQSQLTPIHLILIIFITVFQVTRIFKLTYFMNHEIWN